MGKENDVTNLEQLLDRVEDAVSDSDRVALRTVFDLIGRRSFGPLLLVAGLVTLAPIIGDIPGVPTVMGVLVMLTGGQVLLNHEYLWLPKWLLQRSVAKDRLCRVLRWMRRPACYIDRLLRPRLTILTQRAGIYVIAIACMLVALVMPAMEVVPFSANAAGLVLTAFGLSLIAHDGVLAAFALLITGLAVTISLYQLI